MVLASKFFTPFKRNVSSDSIKSHQLLVRASIISKAGLGLFSWLPLGYRVLDKVQRIISYYHDQIGFNKCCAPILHPAEIWHESGRYEAYGQETMRVTDRHGKELILGPTAEEMFVDAVRQNVTSYKDFPLNLYNIQWKFRDEIRPRFGVMRSREFLMSDAYSFHLDEESASKFYDEVLVGFEKMFVALGFDAEAVLQPDTGEIGGKVSHEFFSKSAGHDQDRVELGHNFLFGTKYTESLGCSVDYKGKKVFPYMGSYGVGVSRLIASYAELFGDEYIKWPANVAPFYITLIGGSDEDSVQLCHKIHSMWSDEIYYQDKDLSFGEKRKIAQIIGSPYVIIAGSQEIKNDYVLVNDEKVELAGISRKINELKLRYAQFDQ